MFIFAVEEDGGGHKIGHFCGRHKCMAPKWFEITTYSIISASSLFFSIKPPTTHPSPYSTDDQTKAPVTFSWHLIFYVEKYFGLLNIASWRATNLFEQGSVTRRSRSLFIAFFLPRTTSSGIPFCRFQ